MMRRGGVFFRLGVACGGVALSSLAFAQDAVQAQRTPEMTWVHLDDDGVSLEVAEDSAHDEWASVCSAPCDMKVSTDFYYRVRGGGHRASNKFALRASDGQHSRLRARGGSTALTVFGWVAIGAGGATALVALDNILLGPLAGPAYTASLYGPSSSLQDEEKGGLILLAISVPLIVAGYFLVRDNRTTTVTQEIIPASTTPSAWLGPREARGPAVLREPLSSASIPLLAVSF
ncbi:MAG TPA: hypothetical protein VKU41_03105 [Polyangiaceae bacterium]|nr:hypothetical protein [Polyangiaceae bacterium]